MPIPPDTEFGLSDSKLAVEPASMVSAIGRAVAKADVDTMEAMEAVATTAQVAAKREL